MTTPLRSAPLGLHAPLLDRARRLRDRDGRRDAGAFLIEGPTLLGDALAAGTRVESLFATASALATLAGASRDALVAANAAVYEVPERAIARLSDLETPPGLVAIVPTALVPLEALLHEADGAPVAILAGIADPGNAGTLLRSAEIFGIARVVFAAGGVEPYHPKVVRAGMGGHFRSRIAQATGAEIVAAAAAARYAIVAAATGGEPLPAFVFPARTALAIGSERHGVANVLPHWDRTLSIPHRGGGESLNAAIAGGILLYALSRSLPSDASGSG